ncbi:DUF4286 family protein [Ferribacterium limneticum]|uniref:DUF4286 family protein n=1 Tax=Ferribacterium limneticum TaxID=76259 RepID=UPI001CF85866|nr:DUF4286 family protein [Ferribacterium limneticum]UCV23648.1 hypothetical protein KI613_03670 [Ferribacterium limneticum]
MNKYVLMVLSNPVAGKEDEYNEWYTNQHLADVLKVPGFKTAQRFTLIQDDPTANWKYLAIYEFETKDPASALAELTARAGSTDMVLSQAMDLQNYSVTPWVAISDKVSVGK